MVYRNGRKIDSPSDSHESEGDNDNETALVPKSIVSGYDIEVGDSIKFKVVAILEDELEIEYAHKSDDDDKDDKPKSDMDRADSDLDALASPTEA